MKQYIGFDIYSFDSKKNQSEGANGISQKTLTLMNLSTESDPLLDITINNVQYGNSAPDSSIATFFSAADYYGSNHRVEFVVQDLSGAEKRDTVTVNVLPENDPPVINDLENTFVSENDSIKLEFGSFTTDIDDTSLTFTVKALRVARQSGLVLTNEGGSEILQDSITITPNVFTSSSILDSVLFKPKKLWSHKTCLLYTSPSPRDS